MVSDTNHRRSIRLQEYDYAQAGAYFVTVCTQNRECLFGKVVDGKMVLNDVGRMAQTVWDGLPGRFPTVELDQFVVMPNHIHGILVLVGAQFIAPTTSGRDKSRPCIGTTEPGARNHPPTPMQRSQGAINRTLTDGRQIKGVINHAPTVGQPDQGVINRAPPLGQIVRTFKAVTTRLIRLTGLQEFRWQRNYYEHIIRDEKSLNRIREYIATNPLRWELDRENPQRTAEDEFDRWLAAFKTRPDKVL